MDVESIKFFTKAVNKLCVLFIDKIDAVGYNRKKHGTVTGSKTKYLKKADIYMREKLSEGK